MSHNINVDRPERSNYDITVIRPEPRADEVIKPLPEGVIECNGRYYTQDPCDSYYEDRDNQGLSIDAQFLIIYSIIQFIGIVIMLIAMAVLLK